MALKTRHAESRMNAAVDAVVRKAETIIESHQPNFKPSILTNTLASGEKK